MVVAIIGLPTDVVKSNNFDHAHSEVALWGQWWVLESVATFRSPKSQISVQENASAAASVMLELAMMIL